MGAVTETQEPIHEFFELSYAHYLVLPRSLLQSMPVEWQKRFVECLDRFRPIRLDPMRSYERGRRRLRLKGKKEQG